MSDMTERDRLVLCRKIAHARQRKIERLTGIIEAQREQLGRQSEALFRMAAMACTQVTGPTQQQILDELGAGIKKTTRRA